MDPSALDPAADAYLDGPLVRDWAYLLASFCSAGSIAISAATVVQHLQHNRQTQLRNYTIRILMMVPIYSTEALAGLFAHEWSELLGVFRECYEAFVLASFVQLLLAYLSLSAPEGAIKVAADMRRVPQIEHMPPFCCLSSWPMGPVFLTRTLIGVLQYSIAMPLITIISLVAWWNRLDGFGELSNFGRAYPYLAFVQNCSQVWALYNLVLFYQATKDKLKAINPLRKFLCIKLVVFFTFWQEVLIALLVHAGAIDSARFMLADWTNTELANGVDNFVICFEMLIFSIAHIFVFPPDDYNEGDRIFAIAMEDPSDDPENHPWDIHLVDQKPGRRELLRTFISGVNFLDILEDIRAMKSLDTEREHERMLMPSSSSSRRGGGPAEPPAFRGGYSAVDL